MKNSSNLLSIVALKTVTGLFLCSLIIISLWSCELEEIPETDDDFPEVTLTIQGPGINRTFTPRDNLDELQLNLLKDATYDFTFLGADLGGVELIVLFAPLSSVDFSGLESDVTRDENGFRTLLSKAGDRSNPLTGLSMTGQMEMVGINNEGFTLAMEVHDFASPTNSTYANPRILIVEDPDLVGLL